MCSLRHDQTAHPCFPFPPLHQHPIYTDTDSLTPPPHPTPVVLVSSAEDTHQHPIYTDADSLTPPTPPHPTPKSFTWSVLQKMWASSCWKRRTRVSPERAPDSSLRWSTPKSAMRSGSSRQDRGRWSNMRLETRAINMGVKQGWTWKHCCCCTFIWPVQWRHPQPPKYKKIDSWKQTDLCNGDLPTHQNRKKWQLKANWSVQCTHQKKKYFFTEESKLRQVQRWSRLFEVACYTKPLEVNVLIMDT